MSNFWWEPFGGSIAAWWLCLVLLGWFALPLAWRSTLLLPGGGIWLAKPIGLLLLVFLRAWISYLHPTPPGATSQLFAPLYAAGLLLLINAALLIRTHRPFRHFLRENRESILIHEILFLAAFLLYLWFRSYVPDATFDARGWHGAEKWGNLAFITSLWRDGSLPPADPWLAGYSINYYYFSHLAWATLARLTAVPPQVAFNLGLATLFALLICLAYSAGRALTERRLGGALAILCIVFAGTLPAWKQLPEMLSLWRAYGPATALAAFDFWDPSDLIPNTRNEFPAFNWLLGDLHAHSFGLILLLIGICLLAQFQRSRETDHPGWIRMALHQPATSALLLVTMAAMWAANAWDLAVFGILGTVWIFAGSLNELSRFETFTQAIQGLLLWILAGILSIRFLAWFYTAHSSLPLDEIRTPLLAHLPGVLGALGSVGWVNAGIHTTWTAWLAYWGLFLLPLLCLVLLSLLRTRPLLTAPRLVAILLAAVLLIEAHYWLPQVSPIGLSLLLVILACAGALIRQRDPLVSATQWIFILAISLLACLALTEFFYLDDAIGPPFQRYNTVFKIYYSSWPLAALIVAAALTRLYEKTRSNRTAAIPETTWPEELSPEQSAKPTRRPRPKAAPTLILAALLLWLGIGGGLYSLLGVATRIARSQDRMTRLLQEGLSRQEVQAACRTLDGLAFMSLPQYAPDDLRLGLWMRENLPDARLIAEAPGDSYSPTARFATISGIPCLLGWQNHEAQWRGKAFTEGIWPERTTAIDLLYSSADPGQILSIADLFGLKWIVIGSLEREKYPPLALDKLESELTPAIRFGHAALYEVPDHSEGPSLP
ncbi:hypothetical protein HQ520_19185 [bacterium]|nr:hypothetical protein [bacterium]